MVPNGWIATQIGELASFKSGGTPSKQNTSYWGIDYPWISGKDLKTHYLSSSIDKLSSAGFDKAKKAPKGASLILVRGMTLLKDFPVGYVTRELAFNQDIKALIPLEHVDGLFLSFWLAGNKHKVMSLVTTAGHGTGRLDTETLMEFPVNLPEFKEQCKIAKILSNWDKAISITDRLIANSKQQKKALMQQLLTGKKRLLDDSGKPFEKEWVNCQIGDLVKEVKRPLVWCDDQSYKLLSVKRRAEGVVLREVLLGHQILTKKMNIAKAGDVLISKMQIVHGAIGYVPQEFNNHHISGSYISLTPKESNSVDMLFFSWFAKQKIMYHKAYLSSYGVHIEKMTFNFKLYLKERVLLPSDIVEQRKIATVLTNADKEIELLEQQLADLKQEQKALMQQLLTGKHRVKVEEKGNA